MTMADGKGSILPFIRPFPLPNIEYWLSQFLLAYHFIISALAPLVRARIIAAHCGGRYGGKATHREHDGDQFEDGRDSR